MIITLTQAYSEVRTVEVKAPTPQASSVQVVGTHRAEPISIIEHTPTVATTFQIMEPQGKSGFSLSLSLDLHIVSRVITVMEPVAFHVQEPVVVSHMVVETVDTEVEKPQTATVVEVEAVSPQSRKSSVAETVDGAAHPILSVDFTDRE